ncbi:MAG: hypothetical protein A3G18_00170 [Rhodospirillales bacterium RIFCSPLOWO2_12_FULL_58_28]|nr:MAG: hypothetical protein A3H92_02780 [Rhodospirillales bacterium RIFCSPLOWO2_02_FULL_58_16]OHC79883.1 MAG: hypothetical protein A3G18_00170 [Rhodospirillales bacterium RIFCSPLOWO2_12_FULL_58_28]
MRDGLKPPKGLKKQFFGVILVIIGLIDIVVTRFMYDQTDGIDLFFIAAGVGVFVFGSVQRRKNERES